MAAAAASASSAASADIPDMTARSSASRIEFYVPSCTSDTLVCKWTPTGDRHHGYEVQFKANTFMARWETCRALAVDGYLEDVPAARSLVPLPAELVAPPTLHTRPAAVVMAVPPARLQGGAAYLVQVRPVFMRSASVVETGKWAQSEAMSTMAEGDDFRRYLGTMPGLRHAAATARAEIAALVARGGAQTERIAQLMAEASNLRRQSGAYLQELAEARERGDRLQRDLNKLRTEYEAATKGATADAAPRVAAAEAAAARSDDARRVAEEELLTMRTNVDRVTKALATVQADRESLIASLESARAERDEARRMVTSRDVELAQKEATIVRLNEAAAGVALEGSALRELQGQLETVQRSLEQRTHELRTATDAAAHADEQEAATRASLQATTAERDELLVTLKRTQAQSDAHAATLETARSATAGLRDALTQAEERNSKAATDLASLQATLDAANMAVSAAEQSARLKDERAEAAESARAAAAYELEKARSDFKSLVDAHAAQVDSLQAQVTAAYAVLDELREQHEYVRSERDDLRTQRDDLLERVSVLQKEQEEAAACAQAAAQSAKDAETAVRTLKAERQADRESAEAKLLEITREKAAREDQFAVADAQLRAMTAERDDALHQATVNEKRLAAEITTLQSSLAAANTTVATLRASTASASSATDVKHLKDEIAILQTREQLLLATGETLREERNAGIAELTSVRKLLFTAQTNETTQRALLQRREQDLLGAERVRAQLQAQITDLTAAAASSPVAPSASVRALEDRLRAAEASASQQGRLLAETKKNFERVEGERTAARLELASVTNALQRSQDDVASLQFISASLHADDAGHAVQEHLQQQLRSANAEAARLHNEVARLTEALNMAQHTSDAECARLTSENETLMSRLRLAGSADAALAHSMAEVETLTNQLRQRDETIASLTRDLAGTAPPAAARLERTESIREAEHVATIQELRDRVRELTNRLHSKDEEIASLRTQVRIMGGHAPV